jgi:hypothetical protein
MPVVAMDEWPRNFANSANSITLELPYKRGKRARKLIVGE